MSKTGESTQRGMRPRSEIDAVVADSKGETLHEVEKRLHITSRRSVRRRGGRSTRRALYVEPSPEERAHRRDRVDKYLKWAAANGGRTKR